MVSSLLNGVYVRKSSGVLVRSGKGPVHKMAAYSASKHAIHGFFGSLRQDLMWHKSNVTITEAVIGRISTENANNALSKFVFVLEVLCRALMYYKCHVPNSNTTLEHHTRISALHARTQIRTYRNVRRCFDCEGFGFGCIEQISSDCVSQISN